MKRFIGFFSAFLALIMMFSCFTVPASALTFDCDVEQYSDSIYMVNLDTGIEVYSKDADTKRYPAALAKIMTYIVVAEYFDDFDTKIEIKQSCIDYIINNGMYCSGVDWYIGESLSVTDLLYAMMLPVGNDATMVLADYIGEGNLQTFADKMNEKAEALGCTNTHFTNPFGYDEDENYTTARDMYTITRFAMGLPLFSKICNTSTHYVEGDDDEDNPFLTTNWMIDAGRGGDYYYMYATGVKNGTTEKAGRCLVATAVYEGYSYMCVCLHAPYDESEEENEQYCMVEAANMFRWAFLNLSFVTVVSKDTPVCEQKVDHTWDAESILLVPEGDVNVILPDDYSDGDIRITPDTTESVSAPISKGDVVTTATLYYKDQEFMKVNLVASDSVGVSPILYTTDAIRGVLTSPWFLIAVGLIVILFIVYVSVSASYAKKKKRNRRDKK